jgi:hypothetical protein
MNIFKRLAKALFGTKSGARTPAAAAAAPAAPVAGEVIPPAPAPLTPQEQTNVAGQVRRKRTGLGSTMTGAATQGTTAGSVAAKALLGL